MEFLKEYWSILVTIVGVVLVVVKWLITYEKEKAANVVKEAALERERIAKDKLIEDKISTYHLDAVSRETELRQSVQLEIERTKNEVNTKLHNVEQRVTERFEKLDDKLNNVGNGVNKAVSMVESLLATNKTLVEKVEKNDDRVFQLLKEKSGQP